MEISYEEEMRNENPNVINNVPILFGSADEMYDYLRLAGDLYNPRKQMYVFGYSDAGAIAVYDVSRELAVALAKKSKELKEDWSGLLGPGGRIYDVPSEEGDDNFAYEFCEDWYKVPWYDTIDYANLVLESENKIVNQREVVEPCPHCDAEVIMQWNVETQGYVVTCPECGKPMMLCDECMHADDNECQRCDWHVIGNQAIKIHKCFRGCYTM